MPHLHWSLLPAYHFEHISPKIHPNLEQTNLFSYLWKTLIFPGKRLDYLGNPYVESNIKYEDWVACADIAASSHQLGAED